MQRILNCTIYAKFLLVKWYYGYCTTIRYYYCWSKMEYYCFLLMFGFFFLNYICQFMLIWFGFDFKSEYQNYSKWCGTGVRDLANFYKICSVFTLIIMMWFFSKIDYHHENQREKRNNMWKSVRLTDPCLCPFAKTFVFADIHS